MGAQRQRARIGGVERLHQLRPQQPRGAQFGDLHEIVHADRPEERQPRREAVDGEPGAEARAHIFDAVGKRIGEFQVLRRAGLLHVIAGNRNRIEFRHVLRGKRKDIGNDPQRRSRRVDISIADHELLEDVVLDGAGEFFRRHALLFGRDDKERQHRQHGAVHGHRHRHLVERNAGEQRAHVVDRVDRDARHADVAAHARMVAVIATVGGKIERNRQAFLARRRDCAGRTRWNPPRWRSRHIAAPSTAASHTWSGRGRADKARCPDSRRGNRAPRVVRP